MRYLIFILLVSVFCLTACEEYVPYARKHGYPRVEMPKKEARKYQKLGQNTCPVGFEYPEYGKISRSLPDSCWVDIYMEPYNLTWHVTYRDILPGSSLGIQQEDHRKLVYKHSQKATRIKESLIEEPHVQGILYEVDGEVGTPVQAFLYDSTKARVALMSIYFQTAERMDSLQPVIRYMKEELDHALATFNWE